MKAFSSRLRRLGVVVVATLCVVSFTSTASAVIVEPTAAPEFDDCNENFVPDVCDLDPNTDEFDCSEFGLVDTSVEPTDHCVDAQPVQLGSYYIGSTVGADSDGSVTCTGNDAPSVWYQFTAPADGDYTFSLGGTYYQLDGYDPAIAVFSSCDVENSDDQLACNDDACSYNDFTHGLDSWVSVSLVEGETVYVRVSGFSQYSGRYQMYVGQGEEYGECPSLAAGGSLDCDGNQVPDLCDVFAGGEDCNFNRKLDACEDLIDCDGNGTADECERRIDTVIVDVDDIGDADEPNPDSWEWWYGVSGPLSTPNFQAIFDVLGDAFGSQIAVPNADPDEDYSGPAFECENQLCPNSMAYPPFGVYPTNPELIAEDGFISGGVYQSPGIYNLFFADESGSLAYSGLREQSYKNCPLLPEPEGEEEEVTVPGFYAVLTPPADGEEVGTFLACMRFHRAYWGPSGFSDHDGAMIQGKYNATGQFVGAGQIGECDGLPEEDGQGDCYVHYGIAIAGNFTGSQCSDCNENNVGDLVDIAQGTSEDCNGNDIPDECETDTDGNGVIDDCEAEIECVDVDVSGEVGALAAGAGNQRKVFVRLLRNLRSSSGLVRDKKFVRKFLKRSRQWQNANLAFAQQLPTMVTNCTPNEECVNTDNTDVLQEYYLNSGNFLETSYLAYRRLRRSLRGGTCEGELATCKQRVRRRNRSAKQLLRRNEVTFDQVFESWQNIPTVSSNCF